MIKRNHSIKVRENFANEWGDYDLTISKVIPFYDLCIETMVSVLKATESSIERILELGVGTGNLAHRLLSEFDRASFVGVDFVPGLLEIARQKLAKFGQRTNFICEDVKNFKFEQRYDLIVTSFVFHHIEDDGKRQLYEKIHKCLSPRGIFINADLVDSPSPFFNQILDQLRMQYMLKEGVDNKTIQQVYVHHRKLAIPAPVDRQLEWLSQIGFKDYECFFKYLNIAVFGGRKT